MRCFIIVFFLFIVGFASSVDPDQLNDRPLDFNNVLARLEFDRRPLPFAVSKTVVVPPNNIPIKEVIYIVFRLVNNLARQPAD